MTPSLDVISDKVAQGHALAEADALALWQSSDLVSLGMLADEARRRRHGAVTTFVRVMDVHAGDPSATPMADAGEIRVFPGPEGTRPSLAHLRALVNRAGSVPVTAGVLDDLVIEAGGIAALPGLLSELRDTGVFGLVAARVNRLGDAAAAVTAVLEAGLVVARFTVDAASESPWSLFERVNRLQQATGAVRAFAPLPWRSTAPGPSTGYQDTKRLALSRLVLNRVPTIQVDWATHGPKLAQVALLFGADNLDAVAAQEALGLGTRRSPLEEVRRNIRAASLTPLERDGRFRSRDL